MLTFEVYGGYHSSNAKKGTPKKRALKSHNELFAKIANEREKEFSGYYALPFESRALEDIAHFTTLRKDLLQKLEHIVLIGVGGSSLGTKAIYHLLRQNYTLDSSPKAHKTLPKIVFLEHTDALTIPQILAPIRLESSLFIAISKSGSTLETSSLLKFVIDKFGLLDSSANKEHLLCITDEDSALQQFAQKESIEYITIKPNIGGRFSVLSAVGLVPLALLGVDVKQILRGAREFMESFFARKEEHILAKALFLANNHKKYPITTLFSYSSVFKEFNAWFVQLWGESLGKINKHSKRVGLSPVGLIGSIDQHSFLQLIVEGRADKSVTFLSVSPKSFKKSATNNKTYPKIPRLSLHGLESTDFVNGIEFSELLNRQRVATLESLASLEITKRKKTQKIPLDSIVLNELSEASVGALVAYFELLTSAVGCALEIDTYNQPGVELGKKRLKDGFSKTLKPTKQ